MKLFLKKKNVSNRYKVVSGKIEVVGVEADSPMEAATKVFEEIYKEFKVEKVNRLLNVGILTEILDLDKYRKDPDNHTFFVLTSIALANAGLHNFSKELIKAEQQIKEELTSEEEGL